ncbi:MAG: hypothetical protein CL467_09355 [Acidimicrobiaceae bacterium]|nr:hypothetical protein [Acidimicrobiaceae bacterium]|tara:strand:+ start:2892 stop:3437 length:546 start_codon:yes stop_codon:yes gene_type:complete
MGQDKALLLLEGRPMASIAADALWEAGASDVVAVGGHQAELGARGLRWIPDDEPGQGPLGGLISALRELRTMPVVVVLACDLPAASPDNINAVTEIAFGLAGSPAAVVPVAAGQRQWLHAGWTAEARPILEAAWSSGERAPHRAGAGLNLVEVEVPDPKGLDDADWPNDLPGGSDQVGPDR